MVRNVVGIIEILDVLDAGPLQVLHAADRCVLVRMRRVGMCVKGLHDRAVGEIVERKRRSSSTTCLSLLNTLSVISRLRMPVRLQPQNDGQHVAGTVSQKTVASSVV